MTGLEPMVASAAVALLAPYLVEMGKGAAKAVGGEAVKPVLDWMRQRLAGPAKEALEELEAHPEDSDNLAVLRKQLTKALAADAALAGELQALLPPDTVQTQQATQIVSGAGAIAAQTVGAHNQTTIHGGKSE